MPQGLHPDTKFVLLQRGLRKEAHGRHTCRRSPSTNGTARDTGQEIWTTQSCAAWILHNIDVLQWKKNTVQSKFAAYKFGVRYVAGRTLPKAEVGDDLYLVQRAVDCMPNDRTPKVAVGRSELLRIAPRLYATLPPKKAAEAVAWLAVSPCGFLARIGDSKAELGPHEGGVEAGPAGGPARHAQCG